MKRILTRLGRVEPKQMNTHVSYVISLDMLSDGFSDPLAEALFPDGICHCSSIPVGPLVVSSEKTTIQSGCGYQLLVAACGSAR